jgi:hypothetical protein
MYLIIIYPYSIYIMIGWKWQTSNNTLLYYKLININIVILYVLIIVLRISMMYTGLLLNATICFAIAISSFSFAWVLARSEEEHGGKSKPALWSLVILWSLIGLTYFPTTIRMIAAYFGNHELDLLMYNLDLKARKNEINNPKPFLCCARKL